MPVSYLGHPNILLIRQRSFLETNNIFMSQRPLTAYKRRFVYKNTSLGRVNRVQELIIKRQATPDVRSQVNFPDECVRKCVDF